MDGFSRFCTAYGRKCLYFTTGNPIPPELPLPMGDLDLPCNIWCFWPIRLHNPNGTSIGSAVFAQMTAKWLYTLQRFACFPLKIAPFHVGIWTSCITWFIAPTRVRNANGNLIVSAIFCRADILTERQTDRQTTLLSAMRRNDAEICGIHQSGNHLTLTYVVPVSHLKTGIQGRINITISLNWKNVSLLWLFDSLLINYYDYSIKYYTWKFTLKLTVTQRQG